MSWNEIRKNVAEVKKNNFSNIKTRLDLNLSKNLLSNYCSLFEIFYELKLRDILFYIIGPLSNNNILAVIVLASLSLEDNEVKEICGKKSINFATSLLNGVSRINLDKVKNLFYKNFTNINDNIEKDVIDSKLNNIIDDVLKFNKNNFYLIKKLSEKLNIKVNKINFKKFKHVDEFSLNKFYGILFPHSDSEVMKKNNSNHHKYNNNNTKQNSQEYLDFSCNIL